MTLVLFCDMAFSLQEHWFAIKKLRDDDTIWCLDSLKDPIGSLLTYDEYIQMITNHPHSYPVVNAKPNDNTAIGTPAPMLENPTNTNTGSSGEVHVFQCSARANVRDECVTSACQLAIVSDT